MIVVLDLDQTLIYCTPCKTGLIKLPNDENYQIQCRPYLGEFLDWVSYNYEVQIWSAGTKEYVERVCLYLNDRFEFKPCRIRTREEMVPFEGRMVKLLTESTMFIVDDNHRYIAQNKQWIPILPWEGQSSDRELLRIESVLKSRWLSALTLL